MRIFYREAGPKDAPHVLLLHGFPSSSHMFRDLIPALADRYHVVAPDYPGFGHSDMPAPDAFAYTFDHLADVIDAFTTRVGLDRYALYVQDYGAPIGFRLAVRHPERIRALVVQNGNAYEEGLREFWDPIKAYWQDPGEAEPPGAGQGARTRVHAVAVPPRHAPARARSAPTRWLVDQALLDRPATARSSCSCSTATARTRRSTRPGRRYFRRHQPPTLIVWGRNDPIFPAEGAHPYTRDLKDVELHLLDTGHFALEEEGDTIARLMRAFLARHLVGRR